MDFGGRRSGGDGKDLGWRVTLFVLGAGLGLGGIVLDSRLMIWAAILVLGGGFAFRFLASGGPPPTDDD